MILLTNRHMRTDNRSKWCPFSPPNVSVADCNGHITVLHCKFVEIENIFSKISGAFATCMALGTKGKVLVGTSAGQIISTGRGGGAENECMNYSSGTTGRMITVNKPPDKFSLNCIFRNTLNLAFEQKIFCLYRIS